MRMRKKKPELRMNAFRSRLPLVATLGASLLMTPATSCAHAGPLKQKQAITRVKKSNVRRLIKALKGDNIKKAIKAAKALVKKRERAIPEMMRLLDGERKTAARALFVLHAMDWSKVHTVQKSIVAKRMSPLLIKFEEGKRAPESYMAQGILHKMRDAGLPIFTKLLKSQFPPYRLLGLVVLDDVEWQWISFKATRPVMDALKKMEKDDVRLFRKLAKRIIKKIRRTFVTCENNTQNLKPEIGISKQETENWEPEISNLEEEIALAA
jgi:hypothetical protein